eukprot:6471041-Prymnesium_polylepis.1
MHAEAGGIMCNLITSYPTWEHDLISQPWSHAGRERCFHSVCLPNPGRCVCVTRLTWGRCRVTLPVFRSPCSVAVLRCAPRSYLPAWC